MIANGKSVHISRILLYLVLLLSAAFFLLPIFLLLNTGFKSYQDVSLSTMWELPKSIGLDSFSKGLVWEQS